MDASSLLLEEINSKVQLFLDIPANKVCADCSALDPIWCSLAFGIVICLNCAGQHRALGVHITQVKSLTLDEWDDRQIIFLKYGGNDVFSQYVQSLTIDLNVQSIQDKYRNKFMIYYR